MRDDALLSVLITLLEPGRGAWDNPSNAEASKRLPSTGDWPQRRQRLIDALMRELADGDADDAAMAEWLRRATEDELQRYVGLFRRDERRQ